MTPMATDRPTLKYKLGCQSGPSTDPHFAFMARYGVRHICASPIVAEPTRLTPTVGEYEQLLEMAARHGLQVDLTDSVLLRSTHIDKERNPSIMLADSPQRDRDIEAFQEHIRTCGRAGIPGIKYNLSLLGVLRNHRIKGRGDAEYLGWDWFKADKDAAATRAGPVDADRYWERIDYFLERVVPVAAEYRVRIACHPHDPGVPPSGYQGIDTVLGTIEGLQKLVSLHESPWHGLNFCQGTVSENLRDPATEIFDVIRWFGTRGKIFNVHFRNIKGCRDRFVESFHDDGDIDMLEAALTYREVGYDGMVMPDHVPLVPDPTRSSDDAYAYNLGGRNHTDDGHEASFAFAYGYIRGLMQAVERFG
jgi:mannonate dehydratase